ncbi:YfiR/HmsC family protein [Bacteroidota bacterium]
MLCIRKFLYKIIIIIIPLFTVFIHYDSYAQEITDAKIKTALIYKFCKYITWNNFSDPDTFKIGVFGNDPIMWNSLTELNNSKAYSRKIALYEIETVEDYFKTDILYVNYESNDQITDLYKFCKNDSTLFITDRHENKRDVMINFVHDENNKVQFELNSKNLNDIKLEISPKLLLLGGTELDVRELYKETEKSLINEREYSEKLSKDLVDKEIEVKRLTSKLEKLYSDIESLNDIIDFQVKSISEQKKNLEKLSNNVQILEKQRETQKQLLDSSTFALNMKNNENLKLDSLLYFKQLEIMHTIDSLETLTKEIKEKEEILNKQSVKIESQRIFLIVILAFFLMVIILAINIYRISQIKAQRNIELEKRNIQINDQKDQIELQANQLKLTNLELEKLSIVAEKTVNAVVIMDQKGDIEWVNEGFVRMFGYTLDEFIQKSGKNFINASTSSNSSKIFEDCIENKTAVNYESYLVTKKGNKKWLQSTITPILNSKNEVIKLVAIDTDITVLKEAEDKIIKKNIEVQDKAKELRKQTKVLKKSNIELEEQKAKAEEALELLKNTQSQLVSAEKMASLGQLTSGIAHEINNPINYISSSIEGLKLIINDVKQLLSEYNTISEENLKVKLNYIENLKNELEYNELLPGFDELTMNIKLGVDRTKKIVNSLRTFSRMDEDNFSFADINNNLDSTLILLGKHHKDRIKIVKKYNKIPRVECISSKISQVFLNILVNAIQSIENEGKIMISTNIEKHKNKDFVCIKISDTGKGMAENIKEKIFEPFFTTKDVGEGTGLGLSIAYSIIKKHKGDIQIESKLGKGATFKILLPVKH